MKKGEIMNWKQILTWSWPKKPKEATGRIDVAGTTVGRKDTAQEDRTNKITTKFATNEKTKIQGWQTQFDDIPKNAKSTQVIIGVDFGTAFTKVVISGAGQKYGIPLNDGAQGSEKYLLPTVLYEDSLGNYTVNQPTNCLKTHVDLKMRILDNNLDEEAKNRIITYIAWVLQKSRSWLMAEKQEVFSDTYLKWAVNIGLPTEKYTDKGLTDKGLTDKGLKKIYIELVKKAWSASTSPYPTSKDTGDSNHAEQNLHPDLIQAFPEFVTQIQGYISSPQRKEGIHALVDVGAGTIDATVFNVHRDKGANVHPIFTSSVKILGTTYLAKHRFEELGQLNDWKPNPQDLSPSREELARKLGITKKELENIDKKFTQKIIQQINSLLRHAKQKMAPIQRDWETGVPLMVCGGGARVEFYQECYFTEVINTLKHTSHGSSLQKSRPPKIEALNAPDLSEEYEDRLSVAFGLSFDEGEIGEIRPLDPIPTKIKNTNQKGSMCPRCGGTGGGYNNCPKCGGSGFL